jgi:Protein of unknown function (DUF3102)
MSDVIPEANSEKVDRHVMAAALKTAGNNLKKVSVPPALSNRRSAEEFVRLITDRRARAVENIVAIGQYLREAKEELDHGEFGPMLERIGFSEGTARKYMAIAAHPAISNRSNWNALPPSWTTLYELTKSPPDVIEARIAGGTITSELEGTAVASLKGEPAGSRNLHRRGHERELERENIRLRSEVATLRARVAELEGGGASQSNGAPAPAPRRVIEAMTKEEMQRLERAGQQRLPLVWKIGADAARAREAVAWA